MHQDNYNVQRVHRVNILITICVVFLFAYLLYQQGA